MAKVLKQKTSGRQKARIDGVGQYDWEEESGGGGGGGSYKVLADDNYQVLVGDDTLEVQSPSGNKTITLPVLSVCTRGQSFKFWGVGSFSQGGDTVLIVPNPADDGMTVGGRASTSFSGNYQKIEVIRGNNEWLAVISNQIPVAG
jgi:hypothetical protein